MKLLAFDTSTEACSVALRWGADSVSRHQIAPKAHGELLLPMVDELLAQVQGRLGELDAIAVGRGPGGFTGVRIAMSAAQGLALGVGVPLVPVSTLAAMAQGAYRERNEQAVLCAIDARMGEVYVGAFRILHGIAVSVDAERVCSPAEVPVPQDQQWFGCGTGFSTYGAELAARLGNRLGDFEAVFFPNAVDLLTLGAEQLRRGVSVAPEEAVPVYLRDKVAELPRSRTGEGRE